MSADGVKAIMTSRASPADKKRGRSASTSIEDPAISTGARSNESGLSQTAWPVRASYALLASFVLLSGVLRYPTTNQELGVDSYSIHALADLGTRNGAFAWLINPLSYVGLSPFSYSPAVPVSLSEFQDLAGVNGELSALLYSTFVGSIFPMTAFALGRAIFRRAPIGLLVSFLVSTAGGMVTFTTFTVSSRGAFLVFAPLSLAFFAKLVLRDSGAKQARTALVLVLFLLLFVHAMFLILIPIIGAAYILYRIMMVEDRLLARRTSATRRRLAEIATLTFIGLALACFVAVGPASETFSGFPVLTSALVPDNLVTRMGVQWATFIGLALVFVPLGIVRLPRIVERKRAFLLLSIALTFLPLALNPVYGLLIAIPVVLLVASMGILPTGLPSNRRWTIRRKGTSLVAIGAAIAILAVPLVVTIPRTSGVPCGEPNALDSQTYNTGMYLKYVSTRNFSFAWDDHIEAERLELISGQPSIEPVLSIGDMEYPWLSRRMSVQFYQSLQVMDFLTSGHQLLNSREWLSMAGTDYPYYWGKHTYVLLQNPPSAVASSQILAFYRASYAVQRCAANHNVFFSALNDANYITYADELQRVYWLGGYP